MTRPALIDLNQLRWIILHSWLFIIDKYNGSCYAINDFLSKISVKKTNKTNNVILNMIARIYKAKTLMNHISCNRKCKLNSTTYNSNQKCNNGKC